MAKATSSCASAYLGARFFGSFLSCRRVSTASRHAHGRRKFFEIAELNKVPIAIEAVRRIDELFAIERQINGKPPDERVAVRQEHAKPLVDNLEVWFRTERKRLSSKNRLAAVALANRIARMAWVVMARGERYREPILQTV